MRKLSRKLFIACLAVAFAVIALGTSTYAWLVVSKTASVDSFSAEVTAGDGSLQVSLTGAEDSYGPNIASSELTQFTNGVKFKDLTLNKTDNKFYTISVDTANKNATLTEAGEASALEGQSIVQFEFFVRLDSTAADGTEKQLQLDLAKTTITPGAEAYSWTPEYSVTSQNADFALTKGTPTTKYFASNAARIMIQHENEIVVVENNVNTGLQDNTATDGAMGYLKRSLGKEPSETITANSTDSQAATNQLGSGVVNLGKVSQTATKVTVTVWIEGFDFDCINAIYKQTLAATLGLTVTDVQ